MGLKGLMLLGASVNTIASNDGGGQPIVANPSWGGGDDASSNALVAVARDELLSWNERIHAALAQLSNLSRAAYDGSSTNSSSNQSSGNALLVKQRNGGDQSRSTSPRVGATQEEREPTCRPGNSSSCDDGTAHYSPIPYSPLGGLPPQPSEYTLPPALMGVDDGDPLNEEQDSFDSSCAKKYPKLCVAAVDKLNALLEGLRVDISRHLTKECIDEGAGPSRCAATAATTATISYATYSGSTCRRRQVPKSPMLGFVPMEQSQSIADEGLTTDSFWTTPQPMVTTTELTKGADATGTKVINQYLIMDTIGQGACGKVKLALDMNRGVTVAMKQVRRGGRSEDDEEGGHQHNALGRRSSGLVAALRREIAIMKKLRHKHIVSLHEVIDDPSAEKLYLVMQYVDQGAVGVASEDGRYARLSDVRVANVVLHVASGLQYLHGAGVVHCDIKPENILVSSEGYAYISDFGVSSIRERATPKHGARLQSQRAGGTPLFMPPEAFVESSSSPSSFKSAPSSAFDSQCAYDIWALGVTIYALLAGRLPFVTVDQLRDPNYRPQLPATVMGENGSEKPLSKKWTLLLGAMLSREPALRPRASQIRGVAKSLKRELSFDGAEGSGPLADLALTDEAGVEPTTSIRVRASLRPSWQDLETAITQGSNKDLKGSASRQSSNNHQHQVKDEGAAQQQEHPLQPRPPSTQPTRNVTYYHREP